MRERLGAMLVAILALGGCGDDGGTDAGTDTGVFDTGLQDTGTPDTAMADSGIDGGGDGGTEVPTVVRALDPAMNEFPESLALHMGNIYASYLFDGRVVRIGADGMPMNFGSVPISAPMVELALGVAVHPTTGDVYVAVSRGLVMGMASPGVYRIPAAGGMGTIFMMHPMLNQPNDVGIDAMGNVYVTDAGLGAIFKVSSAGGMAEIWIQDAELEPVAGMMTDCGPRTTPFPIGVNGISVEADQIIVNNSETASLLRIPIMGDGSAGTIETIVTSCEMLNVADGLVQDADGVWLMTIQSTEALVRVTEAGDITVLHAGDPFHSPAQVDVGMFDGRRQAVVASPSFAELFAGMPPMPNITALPLD